MSASSPMQHCVTLSKSEPEYVAMAHEAKFPLAIKTVVWGSRLSRYCHVLKRVWYIYDWGTGSLILI